MENSDHHTLPEGIRLAYGSNRLEAMRAARWMRGTKATLPQLIQLRIDNPNLESRLWHSSFDADDRLFSSSELVVSSQAKPYSDYLFPKKLEDLIFYIVHGGGLLNPRNIADADNILYSLAISHLRQERFGKITRRKRRINAFTKVPEFSYDEFVSQKRPPIRYVIRMPFEEYQDDDKRSIAMAGGKERWQKYRECVHTLRGVEIFQLHVGYFTNSIFLTGNHYATYIGTLDLEGDRAGGWASRVGGSYVMMPRNHSLNKQ